MIKKIPGPKLGRARGPSEGRLAAGRKGVVERRDHDDGGRSLPCMAAAMLGLQRATGRAMRRRIAGCAGKRGGVGADGDVVVAAGWGIGGSPPLFRGVVCEDSLACCVGSGCQRLAAVAVTTIAG